MFLFCLFQNVLSLGGSLFYVHESGCVSVPLLLFSCVPGLSGEIFLTQTPGAQSVAAGQIVSIKCKPSSVVGYNLNWYIQKPGEAPKLIIHAATNRQSDVSDRFSGSLAWNGADLTLTISGVQAEDSGVYYCQQSYERPFTQ